MPKNRIKLIVNPNADFGHAYGSASELIPLVDEFGGADWAGTVYPTHAVELTKEAVDQGYELIIAAGGDGTVHEVVNGLMQVPKERRPKLGVIPLGSGNDFAHAIGMDSRPVYALRQILTGEPKPVDIGYLVDGHGRDEYWTNAAGIGFDASTTIRFRKINVLRGFFAYLWAVIQTIIANFDSPYMQITTDQDAWSEETVMLVCCNGSREGGGFLVAPDARPDDGILQFASVCKVSRFMMFRLIPEVMRGTHARFSQVRTGQFQRMEIISDLPLTIHMDGEIFAGFGMDVRQISVEIINGGIDIVS